MAPDSAGSAGQDRISNSAAQGSRRCVTLILDVQDDVALLHMDILRAVKIGRPDLYERILSSSCAVTDA